MSLVCALLRVAGCRAVEAPARDSEDQARWSPSPGVEPGPDKQARRCASVHHDGQHSGVSVYDQIARLYDPWSRERRRGRRRSTSRRRGARAGRSSSSASARDGSRCRSRATGSSVIGVDSSAGMLDGRARARPSSRASSSTCASATCATRRSTGAFPLVIDPVPLAAAHGDRRATAARRSAPSTRLLEPGGRLRLRRLRARRPTTSSETHGRWLEREPGIFERADWDEERAHADPARARRERRDGAAASPGSRSPSGARCSSEEGFAVEGLYGWFDRTPWRGRRGLDLGLPLTTERASAVRVQARRCSRLRRSRFWRRHS